MAVANGRTVIWVAALILAVAILYAYARRIKRYCVYQPTKLSASSKPDALPEGVRYGRVPVEDGVEIAVYYNEAVESNTFAPVIVFCHGNFGCAEDVLFHMFGHLKKCGLLVWDYRGFGRSDGEPSEDNTKKDLDRVVRFVREKFGRKPSEIVLWGRSLGTNIVLSYVKDADDPPHKLVLQNPFCRLSDVVAHLGFPSLLGKLLGDMNVADALKNYPGQALVIGSPADTVTPFKNAQELTDACPDRCTLLTVDGGHNATFDDWEALERFVYYN